MQSSYAPCLPTIGKAVPSTPGWLHEVKYDGYRLNVARDGDRVRTACSISRLKTSQL